jgi:hypothetical protein
MTDLKSSSDPLHLQLRGQLIQLSGTPRLFLEQIFKGLAGVQGTRRCRRRGLFFYAHADGIKRALIDLVFAGNSCGDGLSAFKAGGGIEVRALLAGMKFETALGTLSDWIRKRIQQRAALSTACDVVRARHLQRARPEGFFLGRPVGGLSRTIAVLSAFLAATTVVAGLTVFLV